MNNLKVGEAGGIGSELSTRLTEDQVTQLRFATSRSAEPPAGMNVSRLKFALESRRSVKKKRSLGYLLMLREFLIFSAVVLHKEKHLAIRASKPQLPLLG